jgi:hypothetical protein
MTPKPLPHGFILFRQFPPWGVVQIPIGGPLYPRPSSSADFLRAGVKFSPESLSANALGRQNAYGLTGI